MAANTGSRWNPFWQRPASTSIPEEIGQSPPLDTKAKSKTWQTTVSHVPSWPEEGRSLKKLTWMSYVYGVGDIILILLPVYFLLLGVATITLNGKPTKDNKFGKQVEFAMDLGPTMFPIVFAAISGRSLKMVARYLAERGAKISTLELLMASQSVWGTIESQIVMQRTTLVGANLLFLWALSPLGGQASLRLMRRYDQESYSSSKVRYMTTGPGGTMWGLASTYSDSGKFDDAGALYTAALLSPIETKLGPRDPWGNVKIPSLESLKETVSDSEGWISIPHIPHPESYSALVGIPVVGLPSVGSSNFTIESTYLTVDCGGFTQAPFPSLKNSSTDFNQLEKLVPGIIWENKGRGNDPFAPSIGRRATFFMDTNMRWSWGEPTNPEQERLLGRLDGFAGHYNQTRLGDDEINIKRELVFASTYALSPIESRFGLNMARCTLAQNHVEAMVECSGEQCTTKKIRRSLTDTRPSAFTALEHGPILYGFMQKLPLAVPFTIGSSPTERFLGNTSAFPFVQRAGHLDYDVAYTNLSTVTPEVFSQRLSLVLNTYYQLTTQPTGYFGGLSRNLSLYGPDTLPVTDINAYLPSNLSATANSFNNWYPTFDVVVQRSESPFIGATSTASTTTTKEIFLCNIPWLVLLMTSSVIIFSIGAMSLALKHRTLAPELFGFVTSMTYENPWVNIPRGGTMLDATERARLLKDVEVYIGDVRGTEDVGHIALASGVPLRKLERGRLYC